MKNVSQTLARIYAEALSDLGEAQGNLPRIVDDLHAVQELFDKNRDFHRFFVSPRLQPDEKQRILREALGDKLDRPVLGLLHVLIEKRREPILDNVVDEFERFRDLREGRVHAYVTTARPMTEDEKQTLVRSIAGMTGKEVRLHERLEPKLIGGLVVKVGDRVIDGSVRRRLDRLRRELSSARN